MAGNIQDLAFQFDSLGNLHNRNTGRTDLNGNAEEFISETFTYDALNRLTDADTTWDFDSQNARERDYDYDDLGNLTSRTDIEPLTYDQSNGAGVHAVTQANGLSYQYDAYGNIVQRGSETIEYNVFNKPTKIGSTTFRYGPDHQRFKQVDGNRTVYYFNGGQYKEIETDAGTITRNTVGGYYVRETSGSGVKETYLHKDHLGSTGAMTDKWGNLVDRMSFGPWGKRQMADWSGGDPTGGQSGQYPTDKGFTGHEMLDSTSLVHMNGRVYDPVIGRFLSPDLFVQAPYNSQSFNRYSYVLNNPLSLVDPSGYYGFSATCRNCMGMGYGGFGGGGLNSGFSSFSMGGAFSRTGVLRLDDDEEDEIPDPDEIEEMTPEEKKKLIQRLLERQEENGGYIKINGEKRVISYDPSAAEGSAGETHNQERKKVFINEARCANPDDCTRAGDNNTLYVDRYQQIESPVNNAPLTAAAGWAGVITLATEALGFIEENYYRDHYVDVTEVFYTERLYDIDAFYIYPDGAWVGPDEYQDWLPDGTIYSREVVDSIYKGSTHINKIPNSMR